MVTLVSKVALLNEWRATLRLLWNPNLWVSVPDLEIHPVYRYSIGLDEQPGSSPKLDPEIRHRAETSRPRVA